MHVRVRMCLRVWACDVVSMAVSGVCCSRNRLGVRGLGARWLKCVPGAGLRYDIGLSCSGGADFAR